MNSCYVFQYTHFNGTRETWWCSGSTPDEARATAENGGWLSPRWWQWWRHKDRCGVLLENYCALSSGNNFDA